MIVAEDIHTVDELELNAEALIRQMHRRKRPILLTSDGRPDTLMVPVELLSSKQTALYAACQLVDAV